MNTKETIKDRAAKYVFGVANREISKLEARVAELETALEVIEERCDEELGEWSSVEYAHLPVNMSVFWFLREEARALKGKTP